MPAAYDTSSKHFDSFIAEVCPVKHADTIKQIGDERQEQLRRWLNRRDRKRKVK